MPPGGAEVEIAVLFSDVRGSTSLGEQLGPAEFAALLNKFYDVATITLLEHEGTIDKMVGDEVMALFIPGFCGPNYRLHAVRAAEALIRAIGYREGSEPLLPVGVSIHAGPAYVGKVGSGGVTDFTALGDTVNTAARLQAIAGAGEVLLSEVLFQAVAEHYPQLEQRVVTLRGKEEPFAIRVLHCGAR
ncbi:MAG: adenylate/guanylate cyclase domain-containing protein [Deltaproteobacteria bacterium]|nr:adenylate/guanylate cyclase domain-containing protein [Deltaproteobacteria bacterium]